jgi:hypothetical protein
MSDEPKKGRWILGLRIGLVVLPLFYVLASGSLEWLWIHGSIRKEPAVKLSLSPQEAKIVDIAKQAVSANDGGIDRAEFKRPEHHSDGSWSVYVWRKPATPGGHRSIEIDAKGNVTKYIRGK